MRFYKEVKIVLIFKRKCSKIIVGLGRKGRGKKKKVYKMILAKNALIFGGCFTQTQFGLISGMLRLHIQFVQLF